MGETNGKNETSTGMTYERVKDYLTKSIKNLEKGTMLVVVIDVV